MDHLPSVNFIFFHQLICNSNKCEDQEQVGDIVVILIKGTQDIHKRLIYLKKSSTNIVKFEQATGIAIRLGFIEELLSWFELNKKWKDGGYFD